MTYEGITENRKIMEQELWDIKRQRKQPDNEIDHYNMVIEDLQEVINRIDSGKEEPSCFPPRCHPRQRNDTLKYSSYEKGSADNEAVQR